MFDRHILRHISCRILSGCYYDRRDLVDSRDCSLIKQQSVTYIFLTHGIQHFKAKQSEFRDTCQTIPHTTHLPQTPLSRPG